MTDAYCGDNDTTKKHLQIQSLVIAVSFAPSDILEVLAQAAVGQPRSPSPLQRKNHGAHQIRQLFARVADYN